MSQMPWDRIDADKYLVEADAAVRLQSLLREIVPVSAAASEEAGLLVQHVRSEGRRANLIESTINRIGLTSPQGLALMRICEVVLRTPDDDLQTSLIAEQLGTADWSQMANDGDLIAKIMATAATGAKAVGSFGTLGKWTLRPAVLRAIRDMADVFVMGQDIHAALARAARDGIQCSFDMLGEGARTRQDAIRYAEAYSTAISAVAQIEQRGPEQGHGISIKLSALHPRYEALQEARVFAELYPRLESLSSEAAAANIALCLDAEESDRLVLSLKLLERLARSPRLPANWQGLGLAVQAYQKRAPLVIDSVVALARSSGRRLMVRLVKGAYWDGEIKRSQVAGHSDFPVFSRKELTDVSYLACAEKMISASSVIYPMFATHNAHTLTTVSNYARQCGVRIELQRLHGMGEALYALAERRWPEFPVRIYAPVGAHQDLLPYLVRRLLENGANTSFVRALRDKSIDVGHLAADPIAALATHPKLPRGLLRPPPELYPDRQNSAAIDLTQAKAREMIVEAIARRDASPPMTVASMVDGREFDGDNVRRIAAPVDRNRIVGEAVDATEEAIYAAFDVCARGQKAWDERGGKDRASILLRMAASLEAHALDLIALLVREAGKTVGDAISEVREASDFCRYYATLGNTQFAQPQSLNGPAGERNEFSLRGRGVAICISPWNFPLAIFTGQIAAALAAGCTVIAKPAEQTPLIAAAALRLFTRAGLPKNVISLLFGGGELGSRLVSDLRHAVVAFTGGTETAESIANTLAVRRGIAARLVAETGGLNAIFADASALLEHLCDDVVVSAFGSAGQRCSSARLLVVQDVIADDLIKLICGAMDELQIGDPASLDTDIGPIIDAQAVQRLQEHVAKIHETGRVIKAMHTGELEKRGNFFGPVLAEIPSLDHIPTEVFGPILHVVKFRHDDYVNVARSLASKGYGLTLGIHSRLRRFQDHVRELVPVGNVYVNRSTIGAVVGVQPFGGHGRSGTGPKAGGPYALLPFATEQTRSVNILAEGGDPALLAL